MPFNKPDVISWNKYFNNDFTLYQKFEKRVSQKIKYVVQNRHERERDWPWQKRFKCPSKREESGSKNQRRQSQCKIFWVISLLSCRSTFQWRILWTNLQLAGDETHSFKRTRRSHMLKFMAIWALYEYINSSLHSEYVEAVNYDHAKKTQAKTLRCKLQSPIYGTKVNDLF